MTKHARPMTDKQFKEAVYKTPQNYQLAQEAYARGVARIIQMALEADRRRENKAEAKGD